MQPYNNSVAKKTGAALSGVSVRVTNATTGALATIYSDNGVTTQTNPMTTDTNGNYGFYAADGRYVLTFSGSTFTTFTIPVLLEDPADGSAALSASTGSSLVGHIASGAGAVATTVQANLRLLGRFPEHFGAVGDGTTNDAAAVQAALDAASTAGGGIVWLNPAKRYLVDTQDITIPTRCGLMGYALDGGQNLSTGSVANDYSAIPNCIVLNSSYTIRLQDSAWACGFSIARKGITASNNLRQGLDNVRAFAGTAITNAGVDTTIQNLFVIGFELLYTSTDKQRLKVINVQGDNLKGIKVRQCRDSGRIQNVHLWPFLTGNRGYSTTTYTVTGVADNGSGLFRVTTSAANDLTTGDTVNLATVIGSGGMTAAVNKKWTITVITTTTFDLVGSTFAGVYTSGGTVYPSLNWKRTGPAFDVETLTEHMDISHCTAYGYATGARVADGVGWINFVDVSLDDKLEAADPDTVGVDISGSAYSTCYEGGLIGPYGKQIVCNSTATSSHNFIGTAIVESISATVVDFLSGKLGFAGCSFRTGNIYTADAATSLRMAACDIGSAAFTYQTATNNTKVIVDGMPKTGILSASGYRIGYDTQLTLAGAAALLQGAGTGQEANSSLTRYSDTATTSPNILIGRARGATPGTNTIVQSGDRLGAIQLCGADGTNLIAAASLRAEVDGTPGSNDMPGKWIIATTPDGASSPIDRVSVDQRGDLAVLTAGTGVRVKEGSNAKQGASVLVGGTITVANTSVTASSRIILTSNVDGGTPGWLRVSARVVGTSFTITSSSGTDTSTVAWQIFEPA